MIIVEQMRIERDAVVITRAVFVETIHTQLGTGESSLRLKRMVQKTPIKNRLAQFKAKLLEEIDL